MEKRKRAVSAEIFEKLKEMIISGHWVPGERLPTEQQLMEQFGASRIAVREPIKQLASLGLVETRRGAGTYVCGFNSQSFIAPIQSMVVQTLSKQDVLHVLEVREIEVLAAGMAAARGTAAKVAKLRSIHAELQRAADTNSPALHMKANLSFHLQICEMTGNPYFVAMCRLLYESLDRALATIVPIMGPNAALHYHSRLIDTIARHYVHEARAVMREHLDTTVDAVKSIPADDEVFAAESLKA